MGKARKFISRMLCLMTAAGVLGFCHTAAYGSQTKADLQVKPKISGAGFINISENYGLKLIEPKSNERKMIIPGGAPFGIKLRTDGVMVISVSSGSPADKAGIKSGDIISCVNGTAVQTNSDIAEAVQTGKDESTIILSRKNGELCVKVKPQRDGNNYRIGAWVRDSSAGIGTMTFYDPETGSFAGLGHPVSDAATGELMPLSSGEITEAEIFGAIKGSDGEAGKLCGDLCDEIRGSLTSNTPVGVFGKMTENPQGQAIPMAFRNEVKCGSASILSTTSGREPKEYSIEIEKINICSMNSSKSMVIRITDKRLLEQTGGIVRGMSGSPIIQDGKLVGAVTHVCVNL